MHTKKRAGLRVRRYLPVVAALLGSLGFAYACSGAVMSASFATAAADPAAAAYWRRAAIWYEAAAAAFLLGALAGGGVLARRGWVRLMATVALGMLAGTGACGAPAPDKPAQGVDTSKMAVASAAPESVPAPAS